MAKVEFTMEQIEAAARAGFNAWYGARGIAVAGWEFVREPVRVQWRVVALAMLQAAGK